MLDILYTLTCCVILRSCLQARSTVTGVLFLFLCTPLKTRRKTQPTCRVVSLLNYNLQDGAPSFLKKLTGPVVENRSNTRTQRRGSQPISVRSVPHQHGTSLRAAAGSPVSEHLQYVQHPAGKILLAAGYQGGSPTAPSPFSSPPKQRQPLYQQQSPPLQQQPQQQQRQPLYQQQQQQQQNYGEGSQLDTLFKPPPHDTQQQLMQQQQQQQQPLASSSSRSNIPLTQQQLHQTQQQLNQLLLQQPQQQAHLQSQQTPAPLEHHTSSRSPSLPYPTTHHHPDTAPIGSPHTQTRLPPAYSYSSPVNPAPQPHQHHSDSSSVYNSQNSIGRRALSPISAPPSPPPQVHPSQAQQLYGRSLGGGLTTPSGSENAQQQHAWSLMYPSYRAPEQL
jgi:hypothetical protein